MRYSLTRWGRVRLNLSLLTIRSLCLLGKHKVKFGTYPNCIRCGKRAT